MFEIKETKKQEYVNDQSTRTVIKHIAVFEFDLQDLEFILSLVPISDGFYLEISDAISKISKISKLEATSEVKP